VMSHFDLKGISYHVKLSELSISYGSLERGISIWTLNLACLAFAIVYLFLLPC